MNSGNKPCNRLYVGYLPPNITQKELEDLFGKYGTITEVRQNRNFAFIHYSDEASAVNALTELSGQNHFGRKIDVQYARPPRNSGNASGDKKEGEQRDRSPIGGRGGGRGGRGGSFNSRGPFGGGTSGGNTGPFNDQSPFRGGDNSGGDRFGGARRGGEDRLPPDIRSLNLPEPWSNQGPTGGTGGTGGPGSGNLGGGGAPGGGGPGSDPWESGNRSGGPGGGSGNEFRPSGGPPDFRGPDFRDGFRDKGGPPPFGDRGRDSGPFGGGGRGGSSGDAPFGNRDGPPFGGRDSGSTPFGQGGGGRGDGGPPFGRDGPPFGRDGPPFGGGRDGPPFGGGRDGGPAFGGSGRDGPPFGGGRDGPPPFGRDGPPPFGGGRDGAPPFCGGRDGPRGGGGGGPMDFRDSPAFRGGGGRSDFPSQSSWPPGSSEAPPNTDAGPLNVPNSERTNDIEIIVMNKSITDYGEYIESRLKSIGFSVDIMFPNETAPIPRVLGNIASRGTLYAVLVNPQHKINRSLTLLILHGTPQEHRNMLVEDAIVFLNRNFENYTRSCQEKRSPNAPPEQIRHLLELFLSSSRQLTVSQFDILIQHFLHEKEKVEPPASHETPLPVSQQAELQTRILSILNKNAAVGGGPANNSNAAPAPAAPTSAAPKDSAPSPLLQDPSVQRALDSLIQGGNLFRNINNSSTNRY